MKMTIDVSLLVSGSVAVEILDKDTVSFIEPPYIEFTAHPRVLASPQYSPDQLKGLAAPLMARITQIILSRALARARAEASKDSQLVGVAPVTEGVSESTEDNESNDDEEPNLN